MRSTPGQFQFQPPIRIYGLCKEERDGKYKEEDCRWAAGNAPCEAPAENHGPGHYGLQGHETAKLLLPFQDIYGVIEWIFHEDFVKQVAYDEDEAFEDWIRKVVRIIKENRFFYRKVQENISRERLMERLVPVVDGQLRQRFWAGKDGNRLVENFIVKSHAIYAGLRGYEERSGGGGSAGGNGKYPCNAAAPNRQYFGTSYNEIYHDCIESLAKITIRRPCMGEK